MPTSTPPPRTRSKPAPASGSSRPAGLFTWITVGIIAASILAIVAIKVTSDASNGEGAYTQIPSTIYDEVTKVSPSVFDAVGVSSPAIPVTPPLGISGQPPLELAVNGRLLPTVYYYGAEFCPYCAAARWPLIIALSRFGTFTNIGQMQSASSPEIYPDTQSFTFVKTSYSSPYINFLSTEAESRDHATLQVPTAVELAVVNAYDTNAYFPNAGGSIPFISFGNRFLVVGASYDPQALAGLTRAQIAAALSSAGPLTRGIIATANLWTAAICQMDKQEPSAVCASSGVRAADHALHVRT